jgi:hypothetical protein
MSAIVTLITLGASGLFFYAGYEMVSLRTENGNTVAELFDQAGRPSASASPVSLSSLGSA